MYVYLGACVLLINSKFSIPRTYVHAFFLRIHTHKIRMRDTKRWRAHTHTYGYKHAYTHMQTTSSEFVDVCAVNGRCRAYVLSSSSSPSGKPGSNIFPFCAPRILLSTWVNQHHDNMRSAAFINDNNMQTQSPCMHDTMEKNRLRE
jgi:hypothetical protein